MKSVPSRFRAFEVFWHEAGRDEFCHVSILPVMLLIVDNLSQRDACEHVLNITVMCVDASFEKELLAGLFNQLLVLTVTKDPTVIDLGQGGWFNLFFPLAVQDPHKHRRSITAYL